MEITNVLLQGTVLGFSIAAPVGPIAVLCLRRSLNQGPVIGAASGLGAASADALYGAIVGFGLASVHDTLLKMQWLLGVLGGIFLVFLGFKTLFAQPTKQTSEASRGNGIAGAFVSTFLLTLSNPLTMLAFAAVIAAMGLKTDLNYGTAVSFVTGVFLGSAAWYLLLTAVAWKLRAQINDAMFRLINQISGIIILAFAVYILWSAGYMIYLEITQTIQGYVGQAKAAAVVNTFSRILPF